MPFSIIDSRFLSSFLKQQIPELVIFKQFHGPQELSRGKKTAIYGAGHLSNSMDRKSFLAVKTPLWCEKQKNEDEHDSVVLGHVFDSFKSGVQK